VAMGDGSAIFRSSYTLEGKTLKVVLDEYYKRLDYSLEEFEEYRKVINAAADFNKVVVYLEQ
jgi:hypothetical protein